MKYILIGIGLLAGFFADAQSLPFRQRNSTPGFDYDQISARRVMVPPRDTSIKPAIYDTGSIASIRIGGKFVVATWNGEKWDTAAGGTGGEIIKPNLGIIKIGDSIKTTYPVLVSGTQLRSINAPSAGVLYRANINNSTGDFQLDPSDATTADDGVLTIVTSAGARLKRIVDGMTNIKWYGAVGDGIHDDTPAFQAWAASLKVGILNRNMKLWIPKGTYLIKQTIAPPSGANHFEIIGEGELNTTLVWGGTSPNQDFIRITNGWQVKLKDFAMIGQNGANRPARMIHFFKASTAGQDGAVQDCMVESVSMFGPSGDFRDGVAFTCESIGQDANNEQHSLENLHIVKAGRYGVSIEHANSLWNKIIGGSIWGDSAAVSNIRPDGTVSGGFDMTGGTVLQTPGSIGAPAFNLTSSFYPISVTGARAETNSPILRYRTASNGHYIHLAFNICQFQSSGDQDHIDVAATNSENNISFNDCELLGIRAKVIGNSQNSFTIRGGYTNMAQITYGWNVLFDAVKGTAPLTRIEESGGHISINNAVGNSILPYSVLAYSTAPQLTGEKFYQINYSTPVTITDFLGGKAGDEFTLYTDNDNVTLLNGYTFQTPFGYAAIGDAPNYKLPAKAMTKFTKVTGDIGGRWIVQPQISETSTMSRVIIKKGNQYDYAPHLTVQGKIQTDAIVFDDGTNISGADIAKRDGANTFAAKQDVNIGAAAGSPGTSVFLKGYRPLSAGVSYEQAVEFGVGTYTDHSGFNIPSATRFDINLNHGNGISTNVMQMFSSGDVGITGTFKASNVMGVGQKLLFGPSGGNPAAGSTDVVDGPVFQAYGGTHPDFAGQAFLDIGSFARTAPAGSALHIRSQNNSTIANLVDFDATGLTSYKKSAYSSARGISGLDFVYKQAMDSAIAAASVGGGGVTQAALNDTSAAIRALSTSFAIGSRLYEENNVINVKDSLNVDTLYSGAIVMTKHLSGRMGATAGVSSFPMGTGYTVSITAGSNDIGGEITLVTGSASVPTGGINNIVSVAFTTVYSTTPFATFSAKNAETVALQCFISNSTSGLSLSSTTTATANTTYKWSYHVTQ